MTSASQNAPLPGAPAQVPPAPQPGPLVQFPPRRWHLVLAGACVAVVYLAGVTDRWWPGPDSAMYLSIARSIARGEGIQFNYAPATRVTPGLPAVLALVRLAAGPDVWAAHLFMAACGLAGVWLVYKTISLLSDRRMALAVATATAAAYPFYQNAHFILTDVPFMLVFWVMLYAALRYQAGGRKWLVLAVALLAAGLCIRLPGLTAVGPVAVGLILETSRTPRLRKRVFSAAALLVTVLLLAAGFLLAAWLLTGDTPPYLRGFLRRFWPGGADIVVRRETGESPALMALLAGGELLSAVSEIFSSQSLPVVGAVLLAPIVAGCVQLWRTGRRVAPVTLILAVAALGVSGPAFMRARYLLPVAPLLAWALLEGLLWTVALAHRLRKRPCPPVRLLLAATLACGAVVAANLPRVARDAFYHSVLSHTPRYYQVIRKGAFAELLPAAELIRAGTSPQARVATNDTKLSILHYLADRRVVCLPQLPMKTDGDARSVADFVLKRRDIRYVLLDSAAGSEVYRQTLLKVLEQSPALRCLTPEGRHYRVYRRLGPPPKRGTPEPPFEQPLQPLDS